MARGADPPTIQPSAGKRARPMTRAATELAELSPALGLGFLDWLTPLFLAIAVAAWSAAFVGLVRKVLRDLRA